MKLFVAVFLVLLSCGLSTSNLTYCSQRLDKTQLGECQYGHYRLEDCEEERYRCYAKANQLCSTSGKPLAEGYPLCSNQTPEELHCVVDYNLEGYSKNLPRCISNGYRNTHWNRKKSFHQRYPFKPFPAKQNNNDNQYVIADNPDDVNEKVYFK